jgi:hypothetical protein
VLDSSAENLDRLLHCFSENASRICSGHFDNGNEILVCYICEEFRQHHRVNLGDWNAVEVGRHKLQNPEHSLAGSWPPLQLVLRNPILFDETREC